MGVTVPNHAWFVNESVPINPGLVAIIGARGSGKTALADLIAAGAGSDEPFLNDASFVSRASSLLTGSVVTVDWSHGEITSCTFNADHHGSQFMRPVRYLSQQFVDRLCSADGITDDLLAEIRRVVFEAWPTEMRQGATTFDELLHLRLGSARERQAANLGAVLSMSDRITEARTLERGLPNLRAQLLALQKSLSDAQGKISDLTKNSDPNRATRLTLVSEVLRERQTELQRLDRRRAAIEALQSKVTSDRATTFPQYAEKLRAEHADADLADDDWSMLTLDFVGDTDAMLATAAEKASSAVAFVAGEVVAGDPSTSYDTLSREGLEALTVSVLVTETDRLQKLVGLDEHRTQQLKTLSSTATEMQTKIARVTKSIEDIEVTDVSFMMDRRLEYYRAYFDALLEEETQLRELYAPLDRLLSNFGPSVSKLRFVVRRHVNTDAWATAGENLLDLRREGSFRGTGALAAVARQRLTPAWETGDAHAASAAIQGFTNDYSTDLRKQASASDDDPALKREWEQAIARWLYSTDHITLRYSLEYGGLSIERLSPGSRGIVLLLLYLAVDQQETDPLIIDQPEENLDPESVYSELVELFRSASQRRQIIMVTHNANLVVNTDVDQVIVARVGALAEGRLPKLRYMSGGLEDPQIRRSVCEVLEGGADAFRQRARRLGLDLTDWAADAVE